MSYQNRIRAQALKYASRKHIEEFYPPLEDDIDAYNAISSTRLEWGHEFLSPAPHLESYTNGQISIMIEEMAREVAELMTQAYQAGLVDGKHT